MLTCDSYLTPETLAEALELWAAAPEGARLVAGATDILPWAREGRAGDVHLPQMIDVTRIPEFNSIKIENGRVRLGANVVFQQFLTDERLRRHMPCMPFCAIWFADDQIREQATLAGNVVNASPAADGTPPLVAMDAEIEIATLDGANISTRTTPVTEFITGPGRTTLRPGEIVTGISCRSMEGYGGSFEKVGQRRSLVISVVCGTCLVKPDAVSGTFEDVRLAMGGIGPVPIRLTEIETFLKGRPITAETISEASRMCDGLVNSRTRREYRRDVVEGFIARAIEDALHDAGVQVPGAERKDNAHV